MFRAIKGIFTHPEGESTDAIQKVNDALQARYTASALKNLSKESVETMNAQDAERRASSNDRRMQRTDRRRVPDRRVENKFVLVNRRKNNGRRILSRGRRYIPDRREQQAS